MPAQRCLGALSVAAFVSCVHALGCGGEPVGGAHNDESEETGEGFACPQGGRRAVLAWRDGEGEGHLRVFVDLDGDGLALGVHEDFGFAAPTTSAASGEASEGLVSVGWLSPQVLVAVVGNEAFSGTLSADFEDIEWQALEGLGGAEAGNAFLSGWVTQKDEPGQAWGLFDLPWTPQLVRVDEAGMHLQETLDSGTLQAGDKSLARVGDTWLVADPSADKVWAIRESFDDAQMLIDAKTPAWQTGVGSGSPALLVGLRRELWAFQDNSDAAKIYVVEDLDENQSIEPQSELFLLVEPGVCHRPRPEHLAALGERVLWVDDCEGTIVQEQAGEATEQREFSLPGSALLAPDAVSLGLAAWDADCVPEAGRVP